MVAGILFSRIIKISFFTAWAATLLFAAAGAVLLALKQGTRLPSLLLLLSLAGLGCTRAIQTIDFLPSDHIALRECRGEPITLEGWLLRDPLVKPYRTEYLAAATLLTHRDTTCGVSGKILGGATRKGTAVTVGVAVGGCGVAVAVAVDVGEGVAVDGIVVAVAVGLGVGVLKINKGGGTVALRTVVGCARAVAVALN